MEKGCSYPRRPRRAICAREPPDVKRPPGTMFGQAISGHQAKTMLRIASEFGFTQDPGAWRRGTDVWPSPVDGSRIQDSSAPGHHLPTEVALRGAFNAPAQSVTLRRTN